MDALSLVLCFALGLLVAWVVMRATASTAAAVAVGARRIFWPSWFAVVDCETTALDPKRGALVSIGAVHPLTGDEFYCQCWVRPEAFIDSQSMEVNMADWIEDRSQPSESEAVLRFLRWAHKRGVRLLGGKNPTFDVRWLEAAWDRAKADGIATENKFPLTHRTVDLHSLVLGWAIVHRPQALLAEGFKTDDLYPLLDLPREPKPHHALTGARMEAEAFRVILEKGGAL
jgi:DNA polymerase III epsilon subunit-like protein